MLRVKDVKRSIYYIFVKIEDVDATNPFVYNERL